MENSNTREKFTVKRLIFRVNDTFRFSIPISGTLLKYYTDLEENPINKNFAVFGQLRDNNGFLELKTVRLDKVNEVLALFGCQMGVVKIDEE